MYNKIEKWLNEVLTQLIPNGVTAFSFNLYEDALNRWSMEIIGTSSFDPDDSDWACDEVCDFGTRNNPLSWKQEDTTWEQILDEVVQALTKYLEEGEYANVLKSYNGVGVGFVDGDLEILYAQV